MARRWRDRSARLRLAVLARQHRTHLAALAARGIKARPCAAGHGHLAGSRDGCGGCAQARQDIATITELARRPT